MRRRSGWGRGGGGVLVKDEEEFWPRGGIHNVRLNSADPHQQHAERERGGERKRERRKKE